MKILVAGDWHSELHEEAVSKALIFLGNEVVRFPWFHYFYQNHGGNLSLLKTFSGKFQNKLIAGPCLSQINKDFLTLALSQKPDVIFIYRGTHLYPATLSYLKIKLPATVLIGYNNDDPFAKGHSKLLWRHFLAAIPVYDLMLAYRQHNLVDFRRAGAKQVELLRSWFIPERNKPVELSSGDLERFSCDVVFVGHFENDGRVAILEAIVAAGFKLRLYGPGYEWDPVIRKSPELNQLRPVQLIWGEEYNKALCGAKIALCFLSKLNRDTYTRRCFEIPATRTLLMSEYTDDLASLYEEGKEAVFFTTETDLIQKVRHYIANNELRERIAESGYNRVIRDKHDVVSRMMQVLSYIDVVKKRSTV